MADLYSHLCAQLQRAEVALSTDAMMPPVHFDMRKLHVETREQFFTDIRSQLSDFLSTFKPGSNGRRETFYGALYSALVLSAQATDSLLQKKMLVKTYAWLLANKGRAGTCEHLEKSHSLVFPARSAAADRVKDRSRDETQSEEVSEVQTRRPMIPLRTEFMVYVRPKAPPPEALSASMHARILEFQRAQLKTASDMAEAKRIVQQWGRAKSRAEERTMYRAEVREFVRAPEVAPKPLVRRPARVVTCFKQRAPRPVSNLRPRSKLERARMRAERLALVEEQPPAAVSRDSVGSASPNNSLRELEAVKFRLSQDSISVSYKTLACGLVPPRPTLTTQLPKGGEFFTSNPFWRSEKKNDRQPSL